MPMKNMSRQTRFHIGYWIAAIVGLLALQYFYTTAQKVAAIPYSQFEQLLATTRSLRSAFPTVTSRAG
jgi:DNA-binding helix-hairpin-helix protein with protein kinase domain